MSLRVPASIDLPSLRAAYRDGLDPSDLVADIAARIAAWDDPALFIARPSAAALSERAAALAALPLAARASLPLFGIPFVAKDNIDAAGLPTTAACPDYAYLPQRSATVVERLEAAGAILVGKANLDQFATGLVGVRSPYGTPRNSIDARIVPGGSSSGSATAVAAGLATFSLGTDTAGSGRVPAGLNNLVGLKPTGGLVSTRGVVPACRTLDCVSVFALTTDDAFAVLEVVAGYDREDPMSRRLPLGGLGALPPSVRVAVPQPEDRRFFGDRAGAAAFDAAIAGLRSLDLAVAEIPFEPFFKVARLLYEGPWVAERLAAIRGFAERLPSALHPVTRTIIDGAHRLAAVDVFEAQHQLAGLRRAIEPIWDQVDVLAVPTVPRAWTIEEVEAEPIMTNAALGTYTNFVNLLGLCALAVPTQRRPDGLPAGITLIAPGGQDAWLASLGRRIESQAETLGAGGWPRPHLAPVPAEVRDGDVGLVVVGGHLSGMPLNPELRALGATLVGPVRTAPAYHLYALPGGPPRRPGMVQVAAGGTAIEAELWALAPEAFGRFVAAIPAPLSIGSVRLEDGRVAKGFLCEAAALAGAADISRFGGWRAYLAAQA